MRQTLFVLSARESEADSLLLEEELRIARDVDLVRVSSSKELRAALNQRGFDSADEKRPTRSNSEKIGQDIEEDEKWSEMHRALFHGAADGIIVADVASRTFMQANRAACRLLGYTEEELLGLGVADIHPVDALDHVVSEFRAQSIGDKQIAPDIPCLRKDGRVVYADISTALLTAEGKQCMVGVFRDASERRRAQRALHESEQRYRALYHHAFDGILVVDANTSKIIHCNPAICRLLGYSEAELASMSIVEIHPRHAQADALAEFTAVASGANQVAHEIPCLRKDESVVFVDIAGATALIDGKMCVIGVFRDITERKRAEEQRLQLERRMLHAQKLESLGVLAGGIAHDFNNILHTVQGNVDEVLQVLPESSAAWRPIRDIEKSSQRAAALTQQMLDYAGKGASSVEPVCLNEVVRETLNLVRASISRKVSLKTNLQPRLPTVEANATQVQQLVMNLIINASEACGDDLGEVLVSTGVRECDRSFFEGDELVTGWEDRDAACPGQYVYLEVADTGCGMAEDARARVFEPFFTTKSTGRGLGMAAALGIMRCHKGAIRIYSAPGQGTRFIAYLPASAIQTRNSDTGEAARSIESHRGTDTVLLIDDEEYVLDIMSRLLVRAGFNVLTATEGRAGVALLRNHAKDVDVVVLDFIMPKMDGPQALDELRRIRPDLPIIMVSGHDDLEIGRMCTDGSIAGFLQKPFSVDRLMAVLEQAIQSRCPNRDTTDARPTV